MPVDDLPPRAPDDGPAGDDPFANLVLDDEFVRSAAVYEAPARTRTAVRDLAGLESTRRGLDQRQAVPAAPPAPAAWEQPEPGISERTAHVVAIVLALVAVLGGVLVLVVGLAGNREPARRAAPAPATAAGIAPASRSFETGHCYMWDQSATDPDPRDVPCSTAHLFEASASEAVSIAKDHLAGAPYPTESDWDTIERTYCLASAENLLGAPLDPFGRFSVSAIRPTRESWAAGDRFVSCGLDTAVPGVATAGTARAQSSGQAEGADQSWVLPTGVCLALTGDERARIVSCVAAHRAVTIGTVRLPGSGDGRPPAEPVYASRCDAVARARLGASWRPGTGERLGWFTIRAESWAAGSRSFTCVVDYVSATGAPRSVTGDQFQPVSGSSA